MSNLDLTTFEWTEDAVRVSDIDFQKHVHNAVFGVFFANGRYEFLAKHVRPFLPHDSLTVVARTEIDFHASLSHGEGIRTGTRAMRIGRTSLRLHQVIFQGQTHAASAETVMVHVTPGGATPWPEALSQPGSSLNQTLNFHSGI
ncbi:acyl-CoA thioesterase [Devosia sp. A449]